MSWRACRGAPRERSRAAVRIPDVFLVRRPLRDDDPDIDGSRGPPSLTSGEVPVKVVHVLRKYDPREWGGTETALHHLMLGLREHGVESVVMAPAAPPGAPVRSPFEEDGFPVRRYRAFVPAIGVSAAQRRQQIAVGGNLLSWDLLPLLLREPGLSVVHAHTLGRLGGLALTAARLRGVPLVASIHGGALDLPPAARECLAQGARGGLEWGKVVGALVGARRVLRAADAITTCNATEAELQRAVHGPERVHLLPHGVRIAVYDSDRRATAWAAFPRLRGRTVLLCVGRIDPVKNQAWLVGELPAIRARHPDVLLALVGAPTDAAYEAHVRERVAALDLTDHVLLTGPAEPASALLAGLFQAAAVAVLPSLSETFGLILVEAWAAGTVVLSSRTSGALSLVRAGEDGELFDVAAPATFHAALDRLLADPAARARMACAGRERARAQYGDAAAAGRMKALYDGLRARGARRGIGVGRRKAGPAHFVVLRDDDVNGLTPPDLLERLYRPFLERGFPVGLAAIPEVRTDARRPDGALEGFLFGPAAGRPGTCPLAENAALLDYLRHEPGYHVAQHGLYHAHEVGRPEFDRDDAQDLDRRLAAGDRHLAAAGLPPAAAFVAPYDRLSATALRLAARRFPVVSTGWYELGRVPPRWNPARLLQTRLARGPHWRLPGTAFLSHPGCILSYTRDPATMWPALREVIDRQRLTVVVTHHWEYVAGGTENHPFIAALHEVAEELARRPDVRVVTFADVAAGRAPLR